MKWKKFTLTTTKEAVDIISYTLDELGIEGIEIEDNIPLTEKETKGMFIDILSELPPDEGVAKVSFYLDEDDDIPAMMAKVKEALEELKPFTDLGACTFAESETEDKDWINNWKQYFKPFTVDHILIKPTWEFRENIDKHSLCLTLCERHVVLDLHSFDPDIIEHTSEIVHCVRGRLKSEFLPFHMLFLLFYDRRSEPIVLFRSVISGFPHICLYPIWMQTKSHDIIT